MGSIAIKVANMLLGLALAIILARVLGPEGYGTYVYVFALISIMAIPAQFGLPKLVVRETAKAQVDKQWGLMRGVWRWASAAVGVLSGGIAAIALGIIWLLADRFSELQLATFLWGVVLVPLITLGALRGAALQGLRRVVLGQLPEHILRPGLLILLILTIVWGGGGEQLTADKVMSLHVVAAGIAFIVGAWLLYSSRPAPLHAGPKPNYKLRTWLAAAWPLALVAGMQQVNTYTDIVMLGVFSTAEDVGVYRVAVQGAMLTVFGLQTVAMFVSPYFARLHIQGDYERLQRLVTMSARAAFLAAIFVISVFTVLGNEIICLLFGTNYIDAYMPLLILAFGQLINGLFGPVGILLNMTGHERYTARGVTIAAISNVILNLALIPTFGMNGAAVATVITLATWNVLLWRAVHSRLGINAIAIHSIKN
ncbi:flippase [Nitrosococcus wardiae]|uniref:Flippase n=2 Tax=Nitrosococcus wardiae TaxID=1814290 RepID=A0A4P7C4F6_9GAMM|nr:flippase [Nitrosococcus wardiae]